MNLALPGAAVLCLLVALAFLFLFRRLVLRGKEAHTDLEWCREFSIARYRPMERLLIAEDYAFLAGQPGFRPQLSRKLHARRRQLFRQYLHYLSRDFNRLSTAARVLVLHAPQDRPDMAAALFKQRIIFGYAIGMVRLRLMLEPLGVASVDVRQLVGSLEGMRDQLRQLSQRVQPSLA